MWYSTAGCIVMLTLSLLMAPLVAPAQQTAKIARIGLLSLASPADVTYQDYQAFRQGLTDLGWIEGKNIRIEYRYAEGRTERLPDLAAELVRLQVDLIVAVSTPAVRAAKDATTSIPIVIAGAIDPVRLGFVASLARPGGNITGLSHSQPELVGKQLEFLRTLLPTLSRVAFLGYSSGGRGPRPFIEDMQDAAKRLGIQLQTVVIGSVEEMESAFAALSSERAEALVIQPLLIGGLEQGQRIADLAVKHRLPTISSQCGFAEVGGLLSYGPDSLALLRSAAVFVDKILKGAKPGDLPVELAMKFDLVINLKTAKALDLTIPPILLFQADKVIQ